MPDYATQQYSPRSAPAAGSGGGVDLKTLFVTACASAAAAYTSSKLWAPGTLAAAAFTPVLVALLKEAFAKPTEVVARAVPVRGVVRSAPAQGPQTAEAARPPAPADETLVASHPPPDPLDDPAERVAQPGEIQYHGRGRRMRGWRVAIVTGLLGFVVAAVVLTVPELVAGQSAAGGGRDTTIFGGGKERDRSEPAVTTTTKRVQPITAPPVNTVTVPPPDVTTAPPPVTPTAPAPQSPDPVEPSVDQPPAPQPPG